MLPEQLFLKLFSNINTHSLTDFCLLMDAKLTRSIRGWWEMQSSRINNTNSVKLKQTITHVYTNATSSKLKQTIHQTDRQQTNSQSRLSKPQNQSDTWHVSNNPSLHRNYRKYSRYVKDGGLSVNSVFSRGLWKIWVFSNKEMCLFHVIFYHRFYQVCVQKVGESDNK